MANVRVQMFLEFDSPENAELQWQSAIGVRTPWRWDMIPAAISDRNPCSVNIEVPDFRKEEDTKMFRSLPGFRNMGPIEPRIVLPDPKQERVRFWAERQKN